MLQTAYYNEIFITLKKKTLLEIDRQYKLIILTNAVFILLKRR